MKKPLNLGSQAYADNKYAYYKWLRENDPYIRARWSAQEEGCTSARSKPLGDCLGAPLARIEPQIGTGTLLLSNPNLRLAVKPEKLRVARVASFPN